VPSPLKPPPGCRFAPRCPHAIDYCRRRAAHLVQGGRDRLVNCRLAEPIPQAAA
jgi:oligopeptide/dipeptide ABC transporter ATP-binding protein